MGAIVAAAFEHKDPTPRDRAYSKFARHVIAADLRSGQFVTQRELVELTGLPITAIRELVPRLESEGLLRVAPQRGMQLVSVDVHLIRDAFQFRQLIECGAVSLFAKTSHAPTVDRLRRAHDDIIAAAEREEAVGDISPDLIAAAQTIDWDLHATIVDAMQNQIVSDTYRVNAMKVRLIRQAQSRLNSALVIPTMREHLAIIDALAARDPARASEAMAAHIRSAEDKAIGPGRPA